MCDACPCPHTFGTQFARSTSGRADTKFSCSAVHRTGCRGSNPDRYTDSYTNYSGHARPLFQPPRPQRQRLALDRYPIDSYSSNLGGLRTATPQSYHVCIPATAQLRLATATATHQLSSQQHLPTPGYTHCFTSYNDSRTTSYIDSCANTWLQVATPPATPTMIVPPANVPTADC
jgi:hypothetical protein